jgi:hypothetical protein
MDGSSNFARLAFNSHNNVTSVAVEAAAVGVEADALGDLAGDLFEVYLVF